MTIFRFPPEILIETRFLGVGSDRFFPKHQRNRVSVVNIKSYLWVTRKKPGFWGSGGGCWGKETGFLLWVSGVICGMQKRNPVSSYASFKEGEA